ncbi:hypothetical protein M9458_046365, partial [Cirrhinus mrigala]
FSKACKLIPLKGLPTALETAESLFTNVIRNYDLPEDIMSDRGLQFISYMWKAFFRLMGVTVSLSSGYHPQTNSHTECTIQELGHYLRAYCHDVLPWAEYAENSLVQDITGLTPFQCILCFQPPLFLFQLLTTGSKQAQVQRHKTFADARRSSTPSLPLHQICTGLPFTLLDYQTTCLLLAYLQLLHHSCNLKLHRCFILANLQDKPS